MRILEFLSVKILITDLVKAVKNTCTLIKLIFNYYTVSYVFKIF